MLNKKRYLSAFDLDKQPLEEEILEFLFQKEGQKTLDFDSRLFCPFCLIKKPLKTRHVKKLNLCVKDFYFYSKFFDKIVFGKNHKLYFISLLGNLLTVLLFICLTLFFYCEEEKKPFWMLFVEFAEVDFSAFYKAIFIVSLIVLPSLAIDLFIEGVAIGYNLTYDELLKPQHYAYLFTKINETVIYKNPSSLGLFRNIWKFLCGEN